MTDQLKLAEEVRAGCALFLHVRKMAMMGDVSDRVRRIPALDGLRGAAAIAVVLSHAGYTGVQLSKTGGLGVTIFFTLSGFLMAFLYSRQPFDRRSVLNYIVSRVTRIAPLYIFIIIISFVIHNWIDSDFVYVITPSNIIRHLLFFGSQAVFWSIPPEIQFYGFFLIMWWSSQAAQRTRFHPTILTCGLIALMLAFSRDLPGTTLPTKLVFFLFGSVAGLAACSLRLPLSRVACGIVQCGTAIIVPAIAFAISDDRVLYQSISYAAACGLMVFAFSQRSRFGDIVFGNNIIRALGEWSFAIYLIHDPCLYYTSRIMHREGLLVFLIGASISVLAAYILHRLIERPAQRLIKFLISKWGLRYRSDHHTLANHV